MIKTPFHIQKQKVVTTAAEDINSNIVNKYALLLSSIEIGLGSLLHSLHIPFSGQMLSLNQIFLLSLASMKSPCPHTAIKVSTYAGMMKMGLGQGKKLTPMIAIMSQGCLFSLGSFFSTYLGAVLASLWAFVQPILVFYFISAGNLSKFFRFYLEKSQEFNIPIAWIFLAFISLKTLLAVFACYFARTSNLVFMIRYEAFAEQVKITPKRSKNFLLDLFQPFYIISITLLALFYWYSAPDQYVILTLRTIGLALFGILGSRILFAFFKNRIHVREEY